MPACSNDFLRFQICLFLNQNYCLGCSWLERPFSSIAGLDINSPMLAKTSGAEKKSNWHYGELMAVGLMALLSLWVRGPGVDSRRCPFCCGIWCQQSFWSINNQMQEITVLHGCLISIPKFSQKCRTAFAKLLHVKFISWVYILRFYAHTCTRCAPVFFILFLVSVGSIEHHSCESQQIIARRRLSKWCWKGVIPTSLLIWSLHEHRQDNPDWVATGKRVFS